MPGTTRPSITACTREPSLAQSEALNWAAENAVLIEPGAGTPNQDALDWLAPVPPSDSGIGSSKVFS